LAVSRLWRDRALRFYTVTAAIPDGLFMKKKDKRKDAFQELLIFKKINRNLTNQLWFFIKNTVSSIGKTQNWLPLIK
jgi:hypothetical protein